MIITGVFDKAILEKHKHKIASVIYSIKSIRDVVVFNEHDSIDLIVNIFDKICKSDYNDFYISFAINDMIDVNLGSVNEYNENLLRINNTFGEFINPCTIDYFIERTINKIKEITLVVVDIENGVFEIEDNTDIKYKVKRSEQLFKQYSEDDYLPF